MAHNVDVGDYRDRAAFGNSIEYRTGRLCLTEGCINRAGTAWSPLWCVDCNIKRMDMLRRRLATMLGGHASLNGNAHF